MKSRFYAVSDVILKLLMCVQRIRNKCSLEPACRTREHNILDAGCLPNEPSPQTTIISKHHSHRGTFHMFHHPPLELGAFSSIGAMIGAGSAGNPLKRENKRSPPLWWSRPLKRPDQGLTQPFTQSAANNETNPALANLPLCWSTPQLRRITFRCQRQQMFL